MNGENTSQNKQLSHRQKLDGTPFHLIKQTTDNNQTNYFIVMGDYRLTEPTQTEQETVNKLESEKWLIITNIISIASNKIINEQLKETLNLIENLTDKDKQTILKYL